MALAVSLHAPDDALRDELVPLNRKYPLAELLAACKRYLDAAPRDFITFEYCMLDGVNDSLPQADALVRRVRDAGVACKFNLIPFNPFPASGLVRSPRERVDGVRRRAAGGRHRDHGAQDARRRHRRRLRPAGRRGAGPHGCRVASAARADNTSPTGFPRLTPMRLPKLVLVSAVPVLLAACVVTSTTSGPSAAVGDNGGQPVEQ